MEYLEESGYKHETCFYKHKIMAHSAIYGETYKIIEGMSAIEKIWDKELVSVELHWKTNELKYGVSN